MIAETTRWSSGVTLEWALVSLGVGALILAVIIVKMWRERAKKEEGLTDSGEEEPLQP